MYNKPVEINNDDVMTRKRFPHALLACPFEESNSELWYVSCRFPEHTVEQTVEL